ncbi:MAG: DedA family protein, partial [Alicyclobacillus sp.]|nr:DedA family protein [Alicyclobacillus sp.]
MAALLNEWVAHYGSLAIFVLMTLESACIPIPSEVVMPYAGYLASTHQLALTTSVAVATVANVCGGLLAYAVGSRGGRPLILRYGRYIRLNPQHLTTAEHWFKRWG